MKSKLKIINLLLILLISFGTFAQAPQKFNYQAVARDASGNTLNNQAISIRFSIHDGSSSGTIVYQEKQNTSTNNLGLFTLEVGNGVPVQGTFSTIDWSTGSKYLQVEYDPAGNSNYTDLGASELLSVPYALYSAQSGSGGGGGSTVNTSARLIGDGSITSPLDLASQGASSGQVLKWDGNAWTPGTDLQASGGTTYSAGSGISINGSNVISNTGDVSNTNEIQTLSLAGSTLSLSNGGGSVTLPSGGSNDNWGSQAVVTNATLSGNGTSGSPLILAQQSASSGQVLKWNGSSWAPGTDLQASGGATYSAGVGISINGSNVITNTDPDQSTTNEIQSLSIIGNTLSISSGNSVTLPSSGGTSYWAANGSNIFNSPTTSRVKIGDSGSLFTGKFNVNHTSSSTDPHINLMNTNTDYSRINFANAGSTQFWTIAGINGSGSADHKINFYNSQTGDLMTIAGNGKVGIGNTTPNYALSFNNVVGDKLSLFESASGVYGMSIAASRLQLHTPSVIDDIAFGIKAAGMFTEKARITGNGDVVFNRALMPSGNAGTSGQVLQSNGSNAAPTWVTPATNTPQIGFIAYSTSTIVSSPGVYSNVNLNTTETNLGNGFNTTQSKFICPTSGAGFYHFSFDGNGFNSDNDPESIAVRVIKNGGSYRYYSFGQTVDNIVGDYFNTHFSFDTYLNPGDEISLQIYTESSASSNTTFYSGDLIFSGFLIR